MITYKPGPSFSTLDETMKRQKKFDTMNDFLQYLKEMYNKENYTITFKQYSEEHKNAGWSNEECFLRYLYEKEINEEKFPIAFEYYSKEDERIGWSNIFLVMIKNVPHGTVTFDKVKDGTMFNKEGKEVVS